MRECDIQIYELASAHTTKKKNTTCLFVFTRVDSHVFLRLVDIIIFGGASTPSIARSEGVERGVFEVRICTVFVRDAYSALGSLMIREEYMYAETR